MKNRSGKKPASEQTDSNLNTDSNAENSEGKASQKKAEPWKVVLSKKLRKEQQEEGHKGTPNNGRKAELKKVPNDFARHAPGKMVAQGKLHRSKSSAKTLPKEKYILFVCPMEPGELAAVSSVETLKLVASKINPIDSKLPLRGNRPILGGGITFLAQSVDDLKRLQAKLERTELSKDLAVLRPRKRTPEIILVWVDQNLSEERIVQAVLRQNDVLEGASLEIRTSFEGKRGRNAEYALDR